MFIGNNKWKSTLQSLQHLSGPEGGGGGDGVTSSSLKGAFQLIRDWFIRAINNSAFPETWKPLL